MKFSFSSVDIRFRRPMVWVGMVFSAGVFLGLEFSEGRKLLGTCALVLAVTAMSFIVGRNKSLARVAVGCAIAFAGAYRGARAITPCFNPPHIVNVVGGGEVTLAGKLDDSPRRYPGRTYLYLDAEKVMVDGKWSPTEGRVRVTVRGWCPPLRYGDEVELRARLKRPRNFRNPGSFNYERYMAAQNIFVMGYALYGTGIKLTKKSPGGMKAWIQGVRRGVSKRINWFGGQGPEAGILRALLVGDRWAVSGDVSESFSRAGVAHLLAVSGLHVGIVASMAYFLVLWGMKRSEKLMLAVEVKRVAAIVTLIPVAVYAELAGGRIPTMRAAVMVAVYLVAVALGRSSDLRSAIAVAAVLLLALWPASITDAGFLLSFTAVIVIAECVPMLQSRFKSREHPESPTRWDPLKRYIIFSLVTGAAILAATSPIVLRMFHRFQYLSPITNLIFIPLVGYMILPLGLGAIMLHPLWSSGGDWLLHSDLVLTGWTLKAVEWFAQAPAAGMMLPSPSVFESGLILLLALCAIRLLGPPNSTHRMARFLAAAAIVALVTDAAAWYIKHEAGDLLEVTFLDAGNSDAAVVSIPHGKTMLVDTGGKFGALDAGEMIVGPYLLSRGKRSIDAVVITHPHYNNIGGLEWILGHFKVGEIWMADAMYPNDMSERVLWPAESSGVPLRKLAGEDTAFCFGDVKVDALWPPRNYRPPKRPYSDVNAASLVFRLTYDGVSFLFAGDAGGKVQRKIARGRKSPVSSIMLCPHHACAGSLDRNFLKAVRPSLVIISAGTSTYRHCPSKGVLNLSSEQGAETIRIDQSGAVRVRVTNGDIEAAHWTGRKWRRIEKSASYR